MTRAKSNVLRLAVTTFAVALLFMQSAETHLAQELTTARTYVGVVRGTNAYIAVLVEGDRALAAVCDGGSIGLRLRGGVTREGLGLASPTGARIWAVVAGDQVSGGITLGTGATHLFNAAAATGVAGLYRDERTIDGVAYVAAQVVLGDGSGRTQLTLLDDLGEPIETNAPPPSSVIQKFADAPAPRSKTLETKVPPISKESDCRAKTLHYEHLNEVWEDTGRPGSGELYQQRHNAMMAAVECQFALGWDDDLEP
jgi:hypothetical protein